MKNDLSRKVSTMVLDYQRFSGRKKQDYFNKIYEFFNPFIVDAVRSIIRKYHYPYKWGDIDEIVVNAVILLKKAIEEYNGSYLFTTYAVWYIKLAVRTYYLGNGVMKAKRVRIKDDEKKDLVKVVGGKKKYKYKIIPNEVFSLDETQFSGSTKTFTDLLASKAGASPGFDLTSKIKPLINNHQFNVICNDQLINKYGAKKGTRQHVFIYEKIRKRMDKLQRPEPKITPLARRVFGEYIKNG